MSEINHVPEHHFSPCIIGYEEVRSIDLSKSEDGKYIDSKPVESSERVFLDLQFQDGATIRAEVPYQDVLTHKIYERVEPQKMVG